MADHKQMLGPEQMAWLKDKLAASTATFKFIAHGSQVLNESNRHECLAMFEEQDELFDFIKSERIEGVVFLSGDRHFTELLVEQPQDCYPFYEFTCSPLMSFIRKSTAKEKDPEFANPQRVDGTLICKRNYGKVAVSGPADDRVCTMTTYDKKGRKIWEQQIRAGDLRF